LHAAVSIDGTNRLGLRQLFQQFFVGGARSSVNLSILSYLEPEDPDRGDVELCRKRKCNDGSELLIFSERDFVERLAGIIPALIFWPGLTSPDSRRICSKSRMARLCGARSYKEANILTR